MKGKTQGFIRQLQQAAQKLADDNEEVMIVYLYGSVVEGYAHERSDIDLAVVIDKNKCQKSFLEQMRYSDPFEEAFRREKIDLRVLNDAPLSFKYAVVAKGTILYSRDADFTETFETKVQKTYWDFQPHLLEYSRELLTSLAGRT